jgi:di/tricarboxylate transporter
MAEATVKQTPLGIRHLIAALAALAGIVIFAMPAPEGVAETAMRAGAVTVFAIGLYATGVIPEYFTSIVYMFVAVLLAVAPPAVVFSGFHSSAIWLVFGGLVIGLGVRQSGLGARAVRAMMAHFPTSYFGTVAAVTYVGALMGFVIPSAVGRVTLLVPMVLALAERIGFAPGSRGRNGLVLAAAFGTTIPAFAILPANVPNMGLIGAAESIYKITFTYGEYLALNFPVMGLLGLAVMPVLITLRFRDRPQPAAEAEAAASWTRAERLLLVVVLAAIALWATDFVHRISPAWVALGAAVLCLAPRIGILPPSVIVEKLNFGPWFFVAGIIGMGAVATDAGLGKLIGERLLDVFGFAPGRGFANYAAMIALGMGVGIITTLPASPAIMSPLAGAIAQASGWPLESVLLAQVPVWMAFPFPYLVPPVVVAAALGGVSMGQVMRFLFPYFMIGVLVLLPLQYLWGRLLGYYP